MCTVVRHSIWLAATPNPLQTVRDHTETGWLRSFQMRLRTFVPALVILFLSLFATGVVAWFVNRNLMTAGRQQFEIEAEATGRTISNVMATYEQVLRAGAGFFYASPNVTREMWTTFVDAQQLQLEFPGIQGLGYVKVLRPDEVGPHVAEQRKAGSPAYEITPAGARDLYTSIVYLEPRDWRNERAIGYDMFSEPTRRAAMERARDTGGPGLTRKVTLVQEAGQDVQPGTLIYFPLYDRIGLPPTVEERQSRLQGYIYGAFRMRDFFVRLLEKRMPEAMRYNHLQVYDGHDITSASLMFDSKMVPGSITSTVDAAAAPPRFTVTMPLDVTGERWMLRATSMPDFEARMPTGRPWLVVALGGLISALISSIAASLNYARDRSVSAEQTLAAEIKQRRRAQEDAQLANRELIHRVKNTLAIVTSIASQTARYSTSLDEFSAAFRDRMNALSRVHDLLQPNPSYAPELGQFIREFCRPTVRAGRTA